MLWARADHWSSTVEILAMAGPNVKNDLRALSVGDASRTEAIDIPTPAWKGS
jgi:hypothetical protein